MFLALLTNNYYFGQPSSINWWTVIPSIVATLIAATGLYLNRNATRAQTLESIFRDIRDLETEYLLNYDQAPDDQKKIWNAKFFNTIEHLCFELNHKSKLMRRRDPLYRFFKQGLPHWYENLFQKNIHPSDQADPTKFTEFKKLYAEVKQLGENH